LSDPGIDYSLGDGTNADPRTGFRYGVIPLHSLSEWAVSQFEDDYGEPTCPECGQEAEEYDSEVADDVGEDGGDPFGGDGSDFMCRTCRLAFDSEHAYPEEPFGFHYAADGYALSLDPDGDVWVFGSPYVTRAQFCSPCAPGACHLSQPCDAGALCYCLDGSWFEGGAAPYPVLDRKTLEPVTPAEGG
jgi:hypothetical protein